MVSVIITTYQKVSCLSRAIDSVLQQTYSDVEVIVVDDNHATSCYRAQTEQIMERYVACSNVLYIKHEKNMNGAAARNTGIAVAKGEYISFLDNDDFYLPTKIQHCVKFLEENPEHQGVLSDVLWIKNAQFIRIVKGFDSTNPFVELLLCCSVLGSGSNLFVSRKVITELVGFDERFIRHQDVEFMLRFFEKYTVGVLPEILIVKDCSESINIPSYSKMLETRELLYRAFQREIESLSESDYLVYWQNDARMLLQSAYNEGDVALVRDARRRLDKYETNKRIARVIGNFKYSAIYDLAKYVLRPARNKYRHQKIQTMLIKQMSARSYKTLCEFIAIVNE